MGLFEEAVKNNIKRQGIDELMEWLKGTDFFEAPASTRYHGSYKGGLVDHSVNVYHSLLALCEAFSCDASKESIAIVSLFHDICKADTYQTCMKWRKDANDKWEQYPTWFHDENFAFGGHGSKSVYLIMNFMSLTPDEASAINCHMGAWDVSNYSNPSTVYERNRLAWLLHVADEAATYLMDKKEETK